MKLEYEILVNQYGQDLISIDKLIQLYKKTTEDDKKSFVSGVITLIIQSKPQKEDVEIAISNSGLKDTYTACVLMKKEISQSNLYKISNLPSYELEKVIILFLHLFKIAYRRRFEKEKNNIYKWWYWDLSDNRNLDRIKNGKF